MSDDEPVGKGRPPESGQFKKGKSGNPEGRPRTVPRLPVPSQVRRDVLKIADRTVTVQTPRGPENMAMSEAILLSIATKALQGKPTAMKLWTALLETSLEARIREHKPVWLAETLRCILEDPSSTTEVDVRMLTNLIKSIKKLH